MLSRHRYIGPQALIWAWICSATSSSVWLEQALLHMGYIYTWKGYEPFAPLPARRLRARAVRGTITHPPCLGLQLLLLRCPLPSPFSHAAPGQLPNPAPMQKITIRLWRFPT